MVSSLDRPQILIIRSFMVFRFQGRRRKALRPRYLTMFRPISKCGRSGHIEGRDGRHVDDVAVLGAHRHDLDRLVEADEQRTNHG